MYLLFRYKSLNPIESYNKMPGEKIILRAFIMQEIEDRQKEMDSLAKAGE